RWRHLPPSGSVRLDLSKGVLRSADGAGLCEPKVRSHSSPRCLMPCKDTVARIAPFGRTYTHTLAGHPSCSGAHSPDTALGCSSNHRASLSAYSLPRFLTHSVLSGCRGSGSPAHCFGVPVIRFAGRASGSGGYGCSACVRATGTLLAAKV